MKIRVWEYAISVGPTCFQCDKEDYWRKCISCNCSVSETIKEKRNASSNAFVFYLIVLCIIHCTTHSPSSGLLIISWTIGSFIWIRFLSCKLTTSHDIDETIWLQFSTPVTDVFHSSRALCYTMLSSRRRKSTSVVG